MADTTIKIVYTGRPSDEIRVPVKEIAPIFYPDASYVDTDIFTQGFANKDQVGDKKTYDKSIYATNIYGQAFGPGILPIGSAPVPFAYFEKAIAIALKAEEDGTENTGVELTVSENKEVLYFEQMAKNLEEQGFYVKVGDEEFGTAPAAKAASTEA